MKTKPTHTPTPWIKEPLNPVILGGPEEIGICQILEPRKENGLKDAELAKANAAYIVRAVNAHEELVKALRDLYDFHDGQCECEDDNKRGCVHWLAMQALAKAEGKERP